MIVTIRTTEEFLSIIPDLRQYVMNPAAKLGLDLETYNKKRETVEILGSTYLKDDDGRVTDEEEDEEDEDEGVPRPIKRADGSISGHIRLMQIGLDPAFQDIAYVIDVKELGYALVAHHLKDILENATILGQNLKYELQFCWVHLGILLAKNAVRSGRQNALLDLMLMSQVLNAGDKVQHGLGEQFTRYFDLGWFHAKTGMTFDEFKKFKKEEQQIDWGTRILTEDDIKYAGWDVVLLFPLLDAIKEKIRQWRNVYESGFAANRGMIRTIKLECDLIPVFSFMELRGIKIDAVYHRDIVIRYLEYKRDEAQTKVGWTRTIIKKCSNGRRGVNRKVWEEKIEEKLNLRSWQQLKPKINEMLSDQVGPHCQIKKTSEDEIRSVINRHKEEMPEEVKTRLRWVLQYKKAASLLSKFGQKMLDMATDRWYIHPGWFQIGTDELAVSSGRSSCKGPNMMQIPSRGELWVTLRDDKGKAIFEFDDKGMPLDGINVINFFRSSFVAEDGWILVDADYSQEEPRVASDFCLEENMIAEFLKPGKVDVHSIIGKSMCGLDYYPQKGDYERDYIGKTAGLQLLYGAFWTSLKEFMYNKTDGKVDWTDKDAEKAYNNFFGDYPGFRKKMDLVAREMRHAAEQAGCTLAPFKKDRRPFAVAFTYMGRARRFCLSAEQCRLSDAQLDKKYLKPVIDPDTKKVKVDEKGNIVTTNYNTYKERLSSASREGFNHAIQGTSADILKYAILNIHYQFLEAGFDWEEGIVAVIHDEILAHVRKEHAEQAMEIMKRCMKDAFEMFIRRVPCALDIRTGQSWSEAKG